jgi:hypothetical protein
MRALLGVTLAIVSAGCGARTDGLLEGGDPSSSGGPSGDTSFDDASFDDPGTGPDGRPRDASSPDEGFHFDTGLGTDDGVLPGDATRPDAGPMPPPGCPTALPKNGAPCSAEKLACLYAGCDPKVPDRAECSIGTGGKWLVTAAACATGAERCPVAEPIDRSPCTVPPGELCWYDAECLRRSIAQCDPTTLTWSVKKGATCPDTSRCPTTWPTLGSPCPETDPKKGFSCEYVNACGLYQTFICEGDKSVWTDIEEPCATAPSCPATKPVVGASCGALPDGTNCSWPNACGSVDHMDCASGKWRMFHRGKCPDGLCPLTPAEGSSCVVDAGRTCTYPIGGGCALACLCVTGSWTCKQTCGGTSGGK